jgi:hypothetical protein
MNLITKRARVLALLILCLALAGPAFADDGDGANICIPPFGGEFPCGLFAPETAGIARDDSRPGSVMVFPLFIRGGGNTAACGAGNVLVNGECLPRTEIEIGAVCPTRFTTGTQSQAFFPCTEHDPVRIRFRWVCPGTEQKPTCKATGFDVSLSLDGTVVFTANAFILADTNQVRVPAAPCDRGYLIGWVIDEFDRPIKYDGLVGKAVIRNSGTAAATYRGIPIQAERTTTPGSVINPMPGSVINLVPDPLGLEPPGLPFLGEIQRYRVITGQVTGNITFDRPAPAAPLGFGVRSSLILLTLDVRANSPNFPTFVPLDFWNGFEERLSTSVEFVCWGEFQLSADIDPNLTRAFMGTQTGILQSGEAIKVSIPGNFDIPGNTTLLGLIQTNEGPSGAPAARSSIVEFYNNGIHFWTTAFFF